MTKILKEKLEINHEFYILFLNIEIRLYKTNYFIKAYVTEMFNFIHKLLYNNYL